ncbi:MAG: hypothetical protein JXB49_25605 [Bacteroidales bacterium]|nr:hypothetical protein [Bacteroidales bacterium]
MNNNPVLFDKILYDKLRPWLKTNNPDEKFTSKLSDIKTVVADYQSFYQMEFYRPFNNKTKYYNKLIINEMFNYSNQIISLINEDKNVKLRKYWLNDTLTKKLATRLKDIGKLIQDKDYSLSYINPHKTSYNIDAEHKTETYIIQLLKLALIKSYLEIQQPFKNLIPDNFMIEEDFYTQFLFEPIPDVKFIKEVPELLIVEEKEEIFQPKKLSFGYNESSTEKLLNLCKLLTIKVDFLNDNLTSEKDFIEVMASKDLTGSDKQIHIGCETTQFRYIIDKLKPLFSDLTLSNIEKSKAFFSRNGVLITATNLSRNKHHDPKQKETIDKIFKEVQ